MITGLVGVWILPENETMRTRSIRVSSINPKYRSQNGALYNDNTYLNGVDYSDGRICEWTMVV